MSTRKSGSTAKGCGRIFWQPALKGPVFPCHPDRGVAHSNFVWACLCVHICGNMRFPKRKGRGKNAQARSVSAGIRPPPSRSGLVMVWNGIYKAHVYCPISELPGLRNETGLPRISQYTIALLRSSGPESCGTISLRSSTFACGIARTKR